MSLIDVVDEGFLKLLTVTLSLFCGLVTARVSLAVDVVNTQALTVIPIVTYRLLRYHVLTELHVGVVRVLKDPRVGKLISRMSPLLKVVGELSLRV